jgi:hypothetical protein
MFRNTDKNTQVNGAKETFAVKKIKKNPKSMHLLITGG